MNTNSRRLAVALLFAAGAVFAQPAAPLAFEVATIKPSPPLDNSFLRNGAAHIGTKIDAGRVDIGTASLFRLICTAWQARPYQVSGPDWLKTTMFDVQAKIPQGVSQDKVPEMLKTLLIERFGLKLHIENKDQPVYALVVAPGGPKLKESAPEPAPDPAAPPAKPPVTMATVPTLQGDVKLSRTADGAAIEMPDGEIAGKVLLTVDRGKGTTPAKLHLESPAATMKIFAELLSVGVVDRPVIDKTGLTGNYDVAVDITEFDAMNIARAAVPFLPMGGGDGNGANAANPAANLPDPSGSSIFTSIDKLGLKLEPRKLPLEMLVIDHMEKTPTAN